MESANKIKEEDESADSSISDSNTSDSDISETDDILSNSADNENTQVKSDKIKTPSKNKGKEISPTKVTSPNNRERQTDESLMEKKKGLEVKLSNAFVNTP